MSTALTERKQSNGPDDSCAALLRTAIRELAMAIAKHAPQVPITLADCRLLARWEISGGFFLVATVVRSESTKARLCASMGLHLNQAEPYLPRGHGTDGPALAWAVPAQRLLTEAMHQLIARLPAKCKVLPFDACRHADLAEVLETDDAGLDSKSRFVATLRPVRRDDGAPSLQLVVCENASGRVVAQGLAHRVDCLNLGFEPNEPEAQTLINASGGNLEPSA